ncbi:ion transporter [Aestuariirhabdus litorea]|uniref:Ion transporter n=1 Tax=Aestuariirhabdus litorea TaxID=2528527 RepID=A0A3P3VJ93_9GAMM|nr:ion transporter [Aestuariirhabdus litorea]RRJ82417.1 ion transporter [Aestuariirhabdus litorea]RWW92580.1 ion transporter [Endozoicomonadaceae bacterium GTF-13]
MNNQSLQQTFLRIRSNKAFELFVVGVIIFSALVVGAKTYNIDPALLELIWWMDHGITAIFLIEILIRFFGEERKRDFFKQPWNIFDTLIVVVSLVPVDNSDMALVGRLIRVFRVLRMVSIIPELRLLLNSLLQALPKLGYVILLMFIIFYIYAAIGATLFSSINPFLWEDISVAMLTLFRVMTFEDWTDVMYETMEVYPISWLYYLSFIFLTAFAFLNMVIGIVVNVLEEEHQKERDEEALAGGRPSIETLSMQVEELKRLVEQQNELLKNRQPSP